MDNRKLLKFLYKDLNEIEELVTEKGADGFDEYEIEFMQSRFKGIKQLIQILSEQENKKTSSRIPKPVEEELQKVIEKKEHNQPNNETLIEKPFEKEELEKVVVEEKIEAKEEFVSQEVEVKTKTETEYKEKIEEKQEDTPVYKKKAFVYEEKEEPKVEEKVIEQKVEEKQVELEDEVEEKDKAMQRLGDSFSKEKSVNDLVNVDNTKLEHKLSNRPVNSIKSSIGINDRFQYIRELFNGHSDAFLEAVTELDKKNNIQEAVSYLQVNFKWKKNATSLKFVNLVKRRFTNE